MPEEARLRPLSNSPLISSSMGTGGNLLQSSYMQSKLSFVLKDKDFPLMFSLTEFIPETSYPLV